MHRNKISNAGGVDISKNTLRNSTINTAGKNVPFLDSIKFLNQFINRRQRVVSTGVIQHDLNELPNYCRNLEIATKPLVNKIDRVVVFLAKLLRALHRLTDGELDCSAK